MTRRESALSRSVQPHEPPAPAGLAARYQRVRAATEALCAQLSAEDCAIQSVPETSPVKWQLAHTSWFFETFVLERALPGYRPFAPAYRELFNSYYVAVGARHPRPQRGLLSRPGLEEVLRYRAHVDRRMQPLLGEQAPGADIAAAVELGLQHEQQHQELILTDVKHLLSRNPLQPVFRASAPAPGEAQPLRWIAREEGLVSIGHAGPGFAFDNEVPRHRVYVHAFELASRLATDAELLAFVEDGGYQRAELWLSDGWDAACGAGWEAPLYWKREGDEWAQFTLAGPRRLRLAEPACRVSYYEADAFARWSGARLPTEAEWEVVAARAAEHGRATGNFADSGWLHPAPAIDAAERELPAQMYGDAWEWTSSAYSPYPGYRPPVGALGEYNGKFMCNQMVLRGGSCATPRDHIRPSYRNFFHPWARWQFSGIRLARDLAGARGVG